MQIYKQSIHACARVCVCVCVCRKDIDARTSVPFALHFNIFATKKKKKSKK